ncbi:hypothetical protein UlMin_040786 [Ulmus minor]
MTKEEDFKLLKIQTCVLRVNIHCDGCKQKVKKLLQRIEGVFQVSIDSEQQKVTVSGSVDSATLIKKLTRAGKHAELWSQKPNQNQKQKNNCIKDEKNNKGSNNNKQQNMMKGIEAFKNQHKFAPFTLEEEDDDMDDDEEDDEMDDDMRFIRERIMNQQLGLMRQQALEAEAKKGGGGMIPGSNNGKMNHHNNNNGGGNVNGGKKGNPNQNMGMKGNHPGGMDQKTMAALKMNNAHQFGGNISNGGLEGRRPNHDLNTMMNLAGFHGNGPNVASTISGLGGNPNPNTLGGGFQVQPNNGLQASTPNFPSGILTGGHGHGQYPHPSSMMNMNGYNNHPSSMMMNMNMQPRQNQPQVMYQRSTLVPPNTGYYYNYSPYPAPPSPSPYPYSSYPEPTYITGGGSDNSAAHMFSDENTSGCSIM